MVYVPASIFENEYPPFSSVIVPFPISLIDTLAPGIVAPLSSNTFPETVFCTCANKLSGIEIRHIIKNNIPK
ncbi:hypothetical protein D3C85_1557750 [compost metagenome]